jgi:hypothetical protein
MSDAVLQELLDRSEIVALFNRYAQAIDQRDEALYRGCFCDRVDILTPGTQMDDGDADEWSALAVRAVGVFQVTQHVITNHQITLTGDDASCVAYLRAQHWNPDGSLMVGGTYSTKLRRSDDGWKIARFEMTVSWTQPG